jgi:hypothetical protein
MYGILREQPEAWQLKCPERRGTFNFAAFHFHSKYSFLFILGEHFSLVVSYCSIKTAFSPTRPRKCEYSFTSLKPRFAQSSLTSPRARNCQFDLSISIVVMVSHYPLNYSVLLSRYSSRSYIEGRSFLPIPYYT